MFERPEGWLSPFPAADAKQIVAEIKRVGAKTILEFGPGDSTECFARMGMEVTTCEHDPHWYDVAVERFKDTPNVKVLKFENEMPVPPIAELEYTKFDIAFVDAPQGYPMKRKKFKGYEDCSRLNTCLCALERCKLVILHDAVRGLERATLGRLNAMGYKFEHCMEYAKIWLPSPEPSLSTEPSATLEPSQKANHQMPIQPQP